MEGERKAASRSIVVGRLDGGPGPGVLHRGSCATRPSFRVVCLTGALLVKRSLTVYRINRMRFLQSSSPLALRKPRSTGSVLTSPLGSPSRRHRPEISRSRAPPPVRSEAFAFFRMNAPPPFLASSHLQDPRSGVWPLPRAPALGHMVRL